MTATNCDQYDTQQWILVLTLELYLLYFLLHFSTTHDYFARECANSTNLYTNFTCFEILNSDSLKKKVITSFLNKSSPRLFILFLALITIFHTFASTVAGNEGRSWYRGRLPRVESTMSHVEFPIALQEESRGKKLGKKRNSSYLSWTKTSLGWYNYFLGLL